MYRLFALFVLISMSLKVLCQISSAQQQEIDQNISQAEIAASKNDAVGQAQYVNKVAYAYWEAGKQDLAINYFQKSLELNKQIGNQNAIKSIYNSIGMIYTDMQKHEKALEFFEKSFEIRRLINDKSDLASGLMNIALSLENLNRHKEAIVRLDKALEIAKETNNVRMIRSIYGRMAQDYKQIGEQEKSYECMNFYSTFNSHINEQERKTIQNEADQKVDKANTQVKQTEQKLMTTSERLQHTQKDLEEEVLINRERQMEIDLLSKDKLIAELKIKDQEQQLSFEKKIRTVLIVAFLIASILSTVIYVLYRKIKQQGNALRLSEAKIDALYYNSPDAFILFDGVNMLKVNDAAVTLFGFTDKEQVFAGSMERLFPVFQKDKRESKNVLSEKLYDAQVSSVSRFEMLMRKQSGMDFFVEITITRTVSDGKDLYYVVFRDIDTCYRNGLELNGYKTNVDQAVEDHILKSKSSGGSFETLSDLKTSFLTNLILQFKRPLLQLSPLTQVLVGHGELNDKQKEDLRMFDALLGELQKKHEHFTEQARQLEISQQLIVTRFDVYKLLCDAENYAEQNFKIRGIGLKINKSADFPNELVGDYRVLEKILHTLLTVFFSKVVNGEVILHLKRSSKSLFFEIHNPELTLSSEEVASLQDFKDKNDLHNIEFQYCKQLLQMIGGDLVVESKASGGTKFRFSIIEKVA